MNEYNFWMIGPIEMAYSQSLLSFVLRADTFIDKQEFGEMAQRHDDMMRKKWAPILSTITGMRGLIQAE